MCTASWIQDGERLTLFFNRDERRDRPAGIPPRVSENGGIRTIAPRDGLAGGTWIFANEAGCAAVLLNHYPAEETGAPPGDRCVSRGRVLLRLASCRAPNEAGAALRENLASSLFQPFHLLWFGPSGFRGCWTWDGVGLAYEDRPHPPVTTSSWNFREVEKERRRIFSERLQDWERASPETLEVCHRTTSPKGSAYGVLMDRDDACTVSLVRVDIDSARVRMTYWPRLLGGRFGATHSAEIPRTARVHSETHSPCR